MKLKSFITKTLAVSAIAAMAVNCHPDKVEEDALLAGLVASQIRGLGASNCAISLNLATLYSGAIIQQAVNSTSLTGATIFTEEEFEAASATTVAAGQTYETYGQVPYNVKYDAFIRGGGTYTADSRTADINSARNVVDVGAYFGLLAAAVSANGGVATICGSATLRAGVSGALTTWYGTYTGDQKTTLDGTLTAAGTSHTALSGGINNAGTCVATFTAIGARLTTEAGSAYQARQAHVNGSAILACGRIPKSSCSLAGISTANRAAAITAKEKTYADIGNNPDCRKTDADFMNRVRTGLFTGLPRNTPVLGTVASPIDQIGAISEGGTAANNQIFAESAYPVSSALSAISTNFNVAFPLTTGTTAQASSTIPYYGASNINFTVVDSCESVGFIGYGPINAAATTSAALQNRRELTSVKEIAYAFSTQNAAASTYAAISAVVNDEIACNNSFRSKFPIPLAIGGGKLPELANASTGDGGASSNLSLCVYGGTEAGRATSISLLTSGVATLSGIESCTMANFGAANRFGDAGLEKLTNFPNNE
ncbi:hypothetical protein [Leptospira sp. GIMC2001]|uniref:hypothetical protein n=1 Tax=Leptospira sp. GIMC2001 TaxID=1513297 RepID=UPI00234B4B96|nr:hypothetical protein [Leptospira sp. GIMC2001]WCL49777.1 hypothetical protein O4O04_02865 [Leptospira sp. GIMC2001]